MRSPIFQMSRPRSEGVMRLHGPLSNALRAARTARLMSSASPSATLARVSPVAGFGVSNVLPDAASVHCPSMNSFRGAAVNSSTTLSTVTVMKYLISFTLVVTMRQQGLGPAQGGVSKGDTPNAADRDHLAIRHCRVTQI